MRHRAWGLLLAVPVGVAIMVVLASPFCAFHQHLEFAGTPGRFADVVVRAGRADARGALWLDNLTVLAWLLVVPRLLRTGLARWAPERRRRFGVWRYAPRAALVAGVLDGVANLMSILIVGTPDPPLAYVLALAVVSWAMWGLYLGAFVGLLGLVVGPTLAPVLRPFWRGLVAPLDRWAGTASVPAAPTAATSSPARKETSADPTTDPAIGICVSGGGIRSAAVAVGALRSLDEPIADDPSTTRSVFRRARWLVGVSGGAYAAGGWRVTRRPASAVPPPPTDARDGLFVGDGPWFRTVRARRRFLDNGRASIVGGIVGLVARTLTVLGAVLAAAYLAAWAVGRLVRTHAVHPDFPFTDASEQARLGIRELLPMRLVLPGALGLAVATVLLVVAYTRRGDRARGGLLAAARVIGAAGLVLAVLLVGVPIGIVYGRRILVAVPLVARADGGAGLLGGLASLGVVGAITGMVVAQIKRRWVRLGGVFLAIAVFLFAGKVADNTARAMDGRWLSWPIPFTEARLPVALVAALWLIAVDLIASHRLTLGGLYRRRLAATFALDAPAVDAEAARDVPELPPVDYPDEPLWHGYVGADGPELVIAATAHASTDTFTGLPAYGFTFRPDRVTLHDRTDGSSASVAMADYPIGSWWDGYPRGWNVTRSMALTGAAVASAMGRQALGTTNALLVALNLRLGAWVPNPRHVQWFTDPAGAPRVHLGYLAKELLGLYRPDRDPFVYVADGGHRENLGLVELLRERPDVVVCVDASGDRAGSFTTLSEAIELALVELHVDIDVDLTALRPQESRTPLECVVEGVIRYPADLGGGTGRFVYGRAQLCEGSPPDLLRYGGTDRRFPAYSTADQFLTEDEFDSLVALGADVGARIRGLIAGAAPSITGRV